MDACREQWFCTAGASKGILGTVEVHASYQPTAGKQQGERVLWRWVEALECFDGFDGFDGFQRRFGLTFSKAGGRQPTHRSGPFRVISSRRSVVGTGTSSTQCCSLLPRFPRDPRRDPLPPVPFAASFAPIHFAQPRDTLRHSHPAPCPSLALRPCDPATLRPCHPPSTTATD